MTAAVYQSAWETYVKPHQKLQLPYAVLKDRCGAERARREEAEGEAAALRARLVTLEADQAGMTPF